MFRNLYRLRLLDFFELTAATAGALYICQYGGWYSFEERWVAVAATSACILIWAASRFGKNDPTPGFFLATYAGSLYGIWDLSPWIVVFGRSTLVDTALRLFPDSMPVHSWQERCVTIALIAGLMFVPALLFGAVWLSAANLIQLMRRQYQPPERRINQMGLAVQWAISIIFVGGVAYYILRPQIRHVNTIRIAKEREDADSKDAHATTNVLVSQAKGWGFSDGSNHLAILSTKGIAEFTIPQGAQIQAWKLPSGTQFAKRPSLSKSDEGEGYTTIDRWDWLPWRVNLGRFENGKHFAIVSNPELSLYELDSGDIRQIELPPSLKACDVVVYSQSGQVAVTLPREYPGSGPATYLVWDFQTLKKVREFQADYFESMFNDLLITNSANRFLWRDQRVVACMGGWGRGRAFERFSGIRNTSLLFEQPMISDGGNWILSAETLEMPNGEKISLEQFAKAFDVAVLDPEHHRLALVFDPSDRLSSSSEAEFSSTRAPILETLIENPRSALLGLFDPATRRTRTSWTPPGLLRGLEWRSPKITPDGRYLIIQDEDQTADLFHVFAMP